MLEDLTLDLLNTAWERVAYNAGGPGVDGVTIDTFSRQAPTVLPELRLHALDGSYRCLPLRKIVVQKHAGTTDTRTLHVPAVRDRVLQTALARILSRSFEEEFLEASFAYRPDRGVDRAVARILQLRDRGYTFVVDADIRAFFDQINHKLLLDQLSAHVNGEAELMHILKQWVHAMEWDGHEIKPFRRGISQGSPISPLFANLFLTPLDTALSGADYKLIRYSDDFLVLSRSREGAEAALQATRAGLVRLGLELKGEKTRITSFAEGFPFLGVRFTTGDAMIPWKGKRASGRVIFVAHLMSSRLMRPFRDQQSGDKGVEQAEPVSRAKGPPSGSVAAPGGAVEVDVPYLYLTQTGAILRKSGDRFLVEHDGNIVLDIPYHRLEHILIFGNIQITSQAMAEALEKNIALSLFSRQGRFRGSLTPPPGQNVTLRLKQYGIHQDAGLALGAARECIRFKIENALTVLERYEERRTLATEAQLAVEAAEREMTGIQGRLNEADAAESLLGHEGAAAKAYFSALQAFNQSEFRWEGRRKHPATDPLNGLLSLAYTLILNEITALVSAHGLDPAIGFFHEIDGDRPSLSLDLLEPFRAPAADRFVWTIVNRRQFAEGDFEQRDPLMGVFLRPDAQRRFFEAYEQWMLTPFGPRGGEAATTASAAARTFRSVLREEVAAFAAFLHGGGVWSPFSFGRMLREHEAAAGPAAASSPAKAAARE